MLKIDDMVTSVISDIIRDPTPHEESRFFTKVLAPSIPAIYNPNDISDIEQKPHESSYSTSFLNQNYYYGTCSSSRVIKASNLEENTTEDQVWQELVQFGKITNIVLNRWHAVIEFDSKEAAQKWFNASWINNGIYINNWLSHITFIEDNYNKDKSPASAPNVYNNPYTIDQNLNKALVYDNDIGFHKVVDLDDNHDYSYTSPNNYNYPMHMATQPLNFSSGMNYSLNKSKSTEGWILIASGFPEDISTHSIFRLFSLYGNVK